MDLNKKILIEELLELLKESRGEVVPVPKKILENLLEGLKENSEKVEELLERLKLVQAEGKETKERFEEFKELKKRLEEVSSPEPAEPASSESKKKTPSASGIDVSSTPSSSSNSANIDQLIQIDTNAQQSSVDTTNSNNVHTDTNNNGGGFSGYGNNERGDNGNSGNGGDKIAPAAPRNDGGKNPWEFGFNCETFALQRYGQLLEELGRKPTLSEIHEILIRHPQVIISRSGQLSYYTVDMEVIEEVAKDKLGIEFVSIELPNKPKFGRVGFAFMLERCSPFFDLVTRIVNNERLQHIVVVEGFKDGYVYFYDNGNPAEPETYKVYVRSREEFAMVARETLNSIRKYISRGSEIKVPGRDSAKKAVERDYKNVIPRSVFRFAITLLPMALYFAIAYATGRIYPEQITTAIASLPLLAGVVASATPANTLIKAGKNGENVSWRIS